MNNFSFKVAGVDGNARAGVLSTPRGDIPTPVFMPVGTRATVKAMDFRDLIELDAPIILSNTYHLSIRPGAGLVEKAGGLHRFMNWNRPILTDSGGFQVFSLSKLRRIDPDGVTFRSHVDGALMRFTPESVIDLENALGADIIMPLDECLSYPADRGEAEKSLKLTHQWARRSRAYHRNPRQWLFGIIQGGMFEDLRRESARFMVNEGFAGFSIGGLSVGEPKDLMHRMIEEVTPELPAEAPRYLMGVGAPEDFFECVQRGIDMFDCVLPARMARNGTLLTRRGRVIIKNARHRDDFSSPDSSCGCYVCKNHTLSYLRHLFINGEILGPRLATYHNLYFSLNLVRSIREAIIKGEFDSLKKKFLSEYFADK